MGRFGLGVRHTGQAGRLAVLLGALVYKAGVGEVGWECLLTCNGQASRQTFHARASQWLELSWK